MFIHTNHYIDITKTTSGQC